MATCEYSVPNKDISGDNYYGAYICSNEFIGWAWNAYGFNGAWWTAAYGYNAPCDTNQPLARTLNAIWLLAYSGEQPTDTLNWFSSFAAQYTNDLRSACYGNGVALTNMNPVYVELHAQYWYSEDVVGRASTLVHEARHANGVPHNAKFPAWSIYGPGKDGADSNWEYGGAWMYQVLFLMTFYWFAQRTTSTMKDSAKQRGNFFIDNAFAQHPGFYII